MNEAKFAGWPSAARALVERAAERHGGWSTWERLDQVHVAFRELGGPLPLLKGLGRTHHLAKCAHVAPKRQLAVFEFDGFETRFDRGTVSMHPGGGASIDHRRTFEGWRKQRRWTEIDATYFFGYALVTYFGLPFVLADTGFVRSARRGGLDGVTVTFDPGFHTHSLEQSFFFDAEGLLRRHDYVADIVGHWARGAHFSDDYVNAGGLMLAESRRVVAAPFGAASFIPVLHARLGDFRVS